LQRTVDIIVSYTQGENEPERWPDELRFLWDRSLNATELGGLIATRGIYYQYLYSLRLMSDLLSNVYNAYACEALEDYLAWTRAPTGTVSRILGFDGRDARAQFPRLWTQRKKALDDLRFGPFLWSVLRSTNRTRATQYRGPDEPPCVR
jgi:hypothetical protein